MEQKIKDFITYLEEIKNASKNTKLSYQRDLRKAAVYFQSLGIKQWDDINLTTLTSYVLYMEREGCAVSTISRTIAVLKSFFRYLWKQGKIEKDPTEQLKAPKIEKKTPDYLTMQEMAQLFQQSKGKTPKEIRDQAILKFLYTTEVRVSELVLLKVSDVNLELKYFICRGERGERVISLETMTYKALQNYLEQARECLVKEKTDILFVNCYGRQMTRQGVWKIIKGYVERAKIKKEITPHMIRHSLNVHLLQNEMEIEKVQKVIENLSEKNEMAI